MSPFASESFLLLWQLLPKSSHYFTPFSHCAQYISLLKRGLWNFILLNIWLLEPRNIWRTTWWMEPFTTKSFLLLGQLLPTTSYLAPFSQCAQWLTLLLVYKIIPITHLYKNSLDNHPIMFDDKRYLKSSKTRYIMYFITFTQQYFQKLHFGVLLFCL